MTLSRKPLPREIPSYLFLGPAPDFSHTRDRRLRRFLEVLPGTLTWTTLAGMAVASFAVPRFTAFFIIAFDVYWAANAVYFAVFVVRSYLNMRVAVATDWMAKLEALPLPATRQESGVGTPIPDIAPGAADLHIAGWRDIVHLVVLPMVREGVEIVGPTLEALGASRYPNDRLWVVLATEERAGGEAQRTARELRERFGSRFGKFLVTTHPKNIEGEIPGKGSNETYAVKEAIRKLVDPEGVPYEHVLVSSFDSDTRVLPDYFACLTYHYLTTKDPTRASYQPVPLFHNNIWEAPIFSRVAAIGSTTWQLFMQSQPELQETFSSHSMSLRALVDVGFWNRRLVNEDSIIFWQCYLAFDGDYRVVSLFYPVSMDANVGPSLCKTAVSVYKQHRRWAYGIEKISFVLFGFVKNKRIPLWQKLRRSARLIIGFWMWACASLLLLSLGWLPLVVGGDEFRQTVLAFSLPRWTRNLMTGASIGLLVNAGLTFLLLPPKPKERSRWAYASLMLQWFLLPVSLVLFGAIPAIDAQTKMLRGKYLDFWVTEKVRKKKASRRG